MAKKQTLEKSSPKNLIKEQTATQIRSLRFASVKIWPDKKLPSKFDYAALNANDALSKTLVMQMDNALLDDELQKSVTRFFGAEKRAFVIRCAGNPESYQGFVQHILSKPLDESINFLAGGDGDYSLVTLFSDFGHGKRRRVDLSNLSNQELLKEVKAAKEEKQQLDEQRDEWLALTAVPLLDEMEARIKGSGTSSTKKLEVAREDMRLDAFGLSHIISAGQAANTLDLDESSIRKFSNAGRLGRIIPKNHHVHSVLEVEHFSKKERKSTGRPPKSTNS